MTQCKLVRRLYVADKEQSSAFNCIRESREGACRRNHRTTASSPSLLDIFRGSARHVIESLTEFITEPPLHRRFISSKPILDV